MRLIWKTMLLIHWNLSFRTLINQILNMNIMHIVFPQTFSDIRLGTFLDEITVTDIIQFWVKTLDLGLKVQILAVLKVFLEHLKLFKHMLIVWLVFECLNWGILRKRVVLVSQLVKFIELEIVDLLITLRTLPTMLFCLRGALDYFTLNLISWPCTDTLL